MEDEMRFSHMSITNSLSVSVFSFVYQTHLKLNFIVYTVNHKKRDILFLTITLVSLDRFLWFLYHFNHEEILHATVVKFTTSLCAHLTS